MTPDERNLIGGLFDRMRAQGPIQKEYEAEAFITTQVRQTPDAAYMLVQSVLVGEQTLNAASERIQQLEARVRDLESSASRQQTSGGSFLGGLFGGGSKPATSVPPTRSAAPANSPWGQPQQQQPQYQPQYQPQPQGGFAQPAQRSGGGFMAQAMTTAAGVAGGMLAANAISNMLGGGQHGHGASGHNQAQMDASQDAAQDQQLALDDDSQQDQQQDQQYAADDNDPGTTNASDDSWGGGSDSTDA